VARARLREIDGRPLHLVPHDFRRLFATETVNGGLPIHIAAKLLGHLDLNTTKGYVAVYPERVVRHSIPSGSTANTTVLSGAARRQRWTSHHWAP
jgi:integrase